MKLITFNRFNTIICPKDQTKGILITDKKRMLNPKNRLRWNDACYSMYKRLLQTQI